MQCVEPLEPRDGQREVQAGGAAQRVRMPRVVAAGAQHRRPRRRPRRPARRRPCCRGRAGPRAARSVRRGRPRARRRRSTAGRAASAITPVAGASGASRANTAGVDLAREARRSARRGRARAARPGARAARGRGVRTSSGSAPKRSACLSGWKPSSTASVGIAPCAPEARDERSVLHSAIMAAAMKLEGIHHISAITGDAPGNVEFYAGVLGLRMVKKTVNQDEPRVYHLFYGDEHGSPGMDLTFFEYPGAAPGIAGAGMVHRIVWRVSSPAALEFWKERLGVARRRGGAAPTAACCSRIPRASNTSSCRRAAAAIGRSAPTLAGDPGGARAAGLRRRARLQQRAGAQPATARRHARVCTRGEGEHWEVRGERRRRVLRVRPGAAGDQSRARAQGRSTTSRSPRSIDEIEAGSARVADVGVRPDAGRRTLLLQIGVLPRAERRAVRDRDDRPGLRDRRGRSSISASGCRCRRRSSRCARSSRAR